jgi:hypothetical protein
MEKSAVIDMGLNNSTEMKNLDFVNKNAFRISVFQKLYNKTKDALEKLDFDAYIKAEKEKFIKGGFAIYE